jgi:hypothetical protein
MKTFLIGVLVAVLVAVGSYCAAQRRTINALIELNHDKSQYLDSHCSGFTGTEEKLSVVDAYLPGEPTQ